MFRLIKKNELYRLRQIDEAFTSIIRGKECEIEELKAKVGVLTNENSDLAKKLSKFDRKRVSGKFVKSE